MKMSGNKEPQDSLECMFFNLCATDVYIRVLLAINMSSIDKHPHKKKEDPLKNEILSSSVFVLSF
jgi:hypothetical protein